ncbi:hypothetical protein KAT67_09245 [candidate division WOR-3 bacterium]|nr:hypothetical protein [candidate division WOR-3 bacterium]
MKFNKNKYKNIIAKAKRVRQTQKFEELCYPVAKDILKNYEGFEKIMKGPSFPGTPFDLFGFKKGLPYIIELKGSQSRFNMPGEVQKLRMQKVQQSIKGLKIALLQIKLDTGEYRIFYDKDLEKLLQKKRRDAPIKSVVDWIKKRL